jgi:nucleoside-triphosphatase THEP1
LGNGSAELLISQLAQQEIIVLEEINNLSFVIPKFHDEVPPVLD